MEPTWLDWARRLQALGQSGLAYAANEYEVERYQAVQHIAAEMLAAGSGGAVEPILDLFGRDEGYATPKVDVRGMVLRGGRVLLVRERIDGLWTLPGGWADVGQSPRECVEREIWEESGYRARATRLLAVYDRSRRGHPPSPFYIYKMFFLCVLEGGTATTSHETSDVGFFAADELPDLSLARVTPAEIAHMFECAHHPDWPAEFD